MDTVEGYCVRCRQEREIVDVEAVSLPWHGTVRSGVKGVCAVCGAGMYKLDGTGDDPRV